MYTGGVSIFVAITQAIKLRKLTKLITAGTLWDFWLVFHSTMFRILTPCTTMCMQHSVSHSHWWSPNELCTPTW